MVHVITSDIIAAPRPFLHKVLQKKKLEKKFLIPPSHFATEAKEYYPANNIPLIIHQ